MFLIYILKYAKEEKIKLQDIFIPAFYRHFGNIRSILF